MTCFGTPALQALYQEGQAYGVWCWGQVFRTDSLQTDVSCCFRLFFQASQAICDPDVLNSGLMAAALSWFSHQLINWSLEPFSRQGRCVGDGACFGCVPASDGQKIPPTTSTAFRPASSCAKTTQAAWLGAGGSCMVEMLWWSENKTGVQSWLCVILLTWLQTN